MGKLRFALVLLQKKVLSDNSDPKIEKQKDYYNYHVENFIIRIISIADIIGKIGHVVFQTGIDDKRCNGYTFKDKIKITEALLLDLQT